MNKKTILYAVVGGLIPMLSFADVYFLTTPLKSIPQVKADAIKLNLTNAELPTVLVGIPFKYDLKNQFRVLDDYNQYSLDMSSINIPNGLVIDAQGEISGTLLQNSNATFELIASYGPKSIQTMLTLPVRHARSCQELLTASPGLSSGWYALDVDGSGPASAKDYYCDMTSAGGGWTRIVQQFEANPIRNWTGGSNGTSYVHTQIEIPEHTQTAFGKGDDPIFMDYFNFQYSTGDIPVQTLTGLKTGYQYGIHRNIANYYDYHNTEENLNNSPGWINTLTVDRLGGRYYSWAFSVNQTIIIEAGYGLNGAQNASLQDYSWSGWVR